MVSLRLFSIQHCPKIQLRHDTVRELFTIHRDFEENDHVDEQPTSRKSRHGIDDKVNEFIHELQTSGVKPAAMLRRLREKTSIIPTTLQLNNYLKHLRTKSSDHGGLGSRICLNDFIDIYNDHQVDTRNC